MSAVQQATADLDRANALSLALASLTKHVARIPANIAAPLLDAYSLAQKYVSACQQALDAARTAGSDMAQAQQNVDNARQMVEQLNANPCANDAMKAAAERILDKSLKELEAARALPTAAQSAQDMMTWLQRLLTSTPYEALLLSYEDSCRTPGSYWGPNISDVRLVAKSGERLCMIRRNNFQDTVGVVSASDISLGTESLASFLRNIGERCERLGMARGTNMYAPGNDEKCSVRFMHVFLPDHVREFCSTVYNYQTTNAADPKNTIIVAARTGISVCQDTPGKQMLLINGDVQADGTYTQSWFKAAPARTYHSLQAAGAGGTFGLPFMDPADAASCIMTLQVPHQQAPPPLLQRADADDDWTYRSLSVPGASAVALEVGDVAREGKPLPCPAPTRHPTESITVTVTCYAHGVPTEADVNRIVAKQNEYYANCVSGSRHNPTIAKALAST